MYIEYNPNPVAVKVGDCSVRAIAKALNMGWEATETVAEQHLLTVLYRGVSTKRQSWVD